MGQEVGCKETRNVGVTHGWCGFQGFQVLVEMDWLDYGHKFGDRCGHQENGDDVSEQCPVFLQWLDCVHQLLKQFPCLFEFNEAFLVGASPPFLAPSASGVV